MISQYGNSQFSTQKILLTKPLLNKYRIFMIFKMLGNNDVRLILRGTGQNNHNNALIKIDENELLNKGNFIGLYLCVLDRKNLRKVFSASYDTQNNNEIIVKSVNYTTTTFQNNDYSKISQNSAFKNMKFDSSWQASNDLANKILSYDSGYFIILVSCVSWERFITETLVKTLLNCGASNIIEFFNEYRRTFSNETQNTDFYSQTEYSITNFKHPYAFIGIPNIGPGNGFESLRSNIGYYLIKGKYPYAELWVRLKFNPYINLYSFDTIQETTQFRYTDPLDKIKKSKDYTLQSVYEELLDSNKTYKDNLRFVIYRNQDYSQPLLDESGSKRITELDKVFFKDTEKSARFNMKGEKYIDGLDPTQMVYYNFVQNIVDDNPCPPPYTNFKQSNCLDLQSIIVKPKILECGIGIQPQNCPDLPFIENNFDGYV